MAQKSFKFSLLVILAFAAMSILAFAQTAEAEDFTPETAEPEKFYVALVTEVTELEAGKIVVVEIIKGERKGEKILIDNSGVQTAPQYVFAPGDKVVVGQFQSLDETIYYLADYYRTDQILGVLAFFFALAIFFGRGKGARSILGLAFTVAILVWFIVPQILNGASPVLITLAGSFLIAVVAIFLAHGLNVRAAVAFSGTLITLILAVALAMIFVEGSQLLGLGSEEAMFLQLDPSLTLNLQGLLLSGIIIGTLGVLDDVTASQAAVVDEISKANESLGFKELYKRGLSVGHEHIAALVNTLFLAYAGAALPLFLLFYINKTQPLWVILNGELIAEEIVRTMVGSSALVLAVPITTALAAYFIPKYRNTN